MKIQLEQLDLLHPWPQFALRDGFHAIRFLVRIGASPIGEVTLRPARKRAVSHRHLRSRIARLHADALLNTFARLAAAAGPEALQWFMPHAWPAVDLAKANARDRRHHVERLVLQPVGIPSPLRDWALLTEKPTARPPVTIAVCTRDHPELLDGLLVELKQQDYSDFDILVVDNSADAVPTQQVVERHQLTYLRVLTPGVSHARNAALTHARAPLVAFIDDDARPETNWLKELVRATDDKNCRCVTGLTLPAHLDNATEIAADRFNRRDQNFAAAIVSDVDLSTDRFAGAGANMLLHRPFAASIGGFDIELGPGPRSVAGGEDADLIDRIRRAGGNVHVQPRAIVRHDRVTTTKTLRRHVRARAAGRAILLFRRAAYTDRSALRQLAFHAPAAMARTLASGLRGRAVLPFSLTLVQLRATATAPARYALHRLVRFFRPEAAPAQVAPPQFSPAPPKTGESRSPVNRKIAA